MPSKTHALKKAKPTEAAPVSKSAIAKLAKQTKPKSTVAAVSAVAVSKTASKKRKAQETTAVVEPAAAAVAAQTFEFSLVQTEKAVAALLKHVESEASKHKDGNESEAEGAVKKRKLDLLADDPSSETDAAKEAVYLVVSSKKFLSDHLIMKPKRITIPHPIYNLDNTTICLITKDPQRLYKDIFLAPDDDITEAPVSSSLARIVGISKLQSKFKTFESKRQLRDSYDIFLADDRVIKMLPKLLGTTFIREKVLPIPISLLGKDGEKKAKVQDLVDKSATKTIKKKKSATETEEDRLRAEKEHISIAHVRSEVNRTLKSAIAVIPAGVTMSIKIGYSTFSSTQIAENIAAVIEGLVKSNVIKGGFDGVRSLHVKTRSSISLPIYLTDKLD
ncbi:ribosomal protein L1p/L10e family-domain-containing protein [Limtongia smithiae]|uniref:ribosomal protein L1p/L10e family-domain-containing protein n=1 Tax=Limtongia smithiae TaxID=1125753 RepID=UPI0034CD7C7A